MGFAEGCLGHLVVMAEEQEQAELHKAFGSGTLALCHILLAKARHEASPDASGRETDSILVVRTAKDEYTSQDRELVQSTILILFPLQGK